LGGRGRRARRRPRRRRPRHALARRGGRAGLRAAGGAARRAHRSRQGRLRPRWRAEPWPAGRRGRTMKTAFAPEQLADPQFAESRQALRNCVHCGFCTATCPTYVLLGDERDSPRGRIELIRDMLESGRAPTREAVTHLDRCLSCLACATTCPSGVDYGQLIGHARSYIEARYRRPWPERLLRWAIPQVLTRPARLRAALALGRRARRLEPWLARARMGALA